MGLLSGFSGSSKSWASTKAGRRQFESALNAWTPKAMGMIDESLNQGYQSIDAYGQNLIGMQNQQLMAAAYGKSMDPSALGAVSTDAQMQVMLQALAMKQELDQQGLGAKLNVGQADIQGRQALMMATGGSKEKKGWGETLGNLGASAAMMAMGIPPALKALKIK